MGILKNSIKAHANHNYIGRQSFATSNPYWDFYNDLCADEYTSQYPAIRAISQEYMTVRPFAIDANGEPQENNAIINAIYHPNQTDSSVSFFEKIAVSTLVLKKTYILVWSKGQDGSAVPGGDFKNRRGENIAGFTFLESPYISRLD